MYSFRKAAVAVVMAGFLAAPAAAFAQSSSTSTLQALLAQIASLQAQIQALQTQKQEVVATLVSTLRQGDRGENVRQLQQLLAADPSVYPEGIVSGYFGRLTAQAIKRFQKQHGIEQVGHVGPKTLKKLNELFSKKGDWKDRDDDDLENATTTPGVGLVAVCHKAGKHNAHTIYVGAPAVQSHLKHGDTMGVCGGSTGTTTPDTAAPVISGITASNISTTGATINWTTNEGATTQVEYGTTTSYGLFSSLNASLVTSHSTALTGLTPNTTYNYRVWSKDAANNTASSSNFTFTTAALDTTAPVISAVSAGSIGSTTATIAWTTNESATGKVYFGTADPLVLGSASSVSTSTLSTLHSFGLSGLTASTTYFYVVESMDASNNTATSSQGSFTTAN